MFYSQRKSDIIFLWIFLALGAHLSTSHVHFPFRESHSKNTKSHAENIEDENEMHNDGTYYFLGHPTGVAVHPMTMVNKPGNITDPKSDDKVTDILHGLLAKYDNRIRPYFANLPTMITVYVSELQVVDVDESKSAFTCTVLLQQTWVDPRLVYETSEQSMDVPSITISHDHTRELWLPDTYFLNEKKAQVHEMTMTNDAVVLFRNGTVVRSMRITVTSYCPMTYQDFPFETQKCELQIASHGYGEKDIEIYWEESFIKMMMPTDNDLNANNWKPLVTDVHTGTFMVTNVVMKEASEEFIHFGKKNYLSLQIHLQRAWKPFITRFYMPMVLFSFTSLATLFIQDVKVALIVNLFNLAFINIFVALRSTSQDTPRTSSKTALDNYFIICLTYVLLVVLITLYKLVRKSQQIYQVSSDATTTSSMAIGQSGFTIERASSSRRRNQDQMDIFNPMRNVQGQSESLSTGSSRNHIQNGGNDGETDGNDEDNGFRQVYRSPSYPLTLSSRTRFVFKKIAKFGFWLSKYLRWIFLVSFLITDFVYFKIHVVQYN